MQSEINLIFDLFNKIGRDIAGRKVVFTWDNWGLAMPEATSILQELDDAIVKGSAESRERALWHATDLLIAGRYSDNDIWIFGEAIGRLAEEIEVVARARLAKRLAHAAMLQPMSLEGLHSTIRSLSPALSSGIPNSSIPRL